MSKGNRAILDHAQQGRALRVFEGAKGNVSYLGEFALDPDVPWHEETSRESGSSAERKVIIFRLVPVDHFYHQGKFHRRTQVQPELRQTYREADETTVIESIKPAMQLSTPTPGPAQRRRLLAGRPDTACSDPA